MMSTVSQLRCSPHLQYPTCFPLLHSLPCFPPSLLISQCSGVALSCGTESRLWGNLRKVRRHIRLQRIVLDQFRRQTFHHLCAVVCYSKMDPMTQSAQISSSQGFADGQNSAAKESKLSVKDLIHWRDPKKSGVVFGLSLLMLLSLAAFSIISVVSYLLLALLCVTITFRIYKSVVQAVQKSSDGHPFKTLIDKDVSIPPETFRKHVDASLTYINRALKQMSRLFLVEDLVDSLKLAVVMWLLTYVGAVFNGITILILADILLFAVPPVYEKNKTQIDQYIDLARTQINTTMAKLQEKLPGAVKRSKTE